MYRYTGDTRNNGDAGENHVRFYDDNFYVRQRQSDEFIRELTHAAAQRRSRAAVSDTSPASSSPSCLRPIGRLSQQQQQLVQSSTSPIPVYKPSIGQVIPSIEWTVTLCNKMYSV